MRKVPPQYENPVDNIFIDAASQVGPMLHETFGVVPNTVTLAAMVTGCLAAWHIYAGQFALGVLWLLVSYFLDCVDGNMARRYNLVSDFGDKFDHISDVTKILLVFLAVLYTPHASSMSKVVFAIVSGGCLALALPQLGCQENLYSPQRYTGDAFLSPVRALCPHHDPRRAMAFTRYFGLGTFVAVTCSLILILASAPRDYDMPAGADG